MGNPVASDMYVNVPLMNVALQFMQDETAFIADQVFPVVPTPYEAGIYWKYIPDDWYRIEARERASATESAGGGWRVSTQSYFNRLFALHKDVADKDRAASMLPTSLDITATQYVTRQLLLKREYDWAAKYFTTGVWGTDITGVTSGPTGNQVLQWDNANATPINDIKKWIRQVQSQTGFKPNRLVLGPYVLDALENNGSVLDRIKYTQRGEVTTDLLQSLFGIDKVLVAEAIQNTASEGANAAYSFMYGKSALLAYAADAPARENPSAGYFFTWEGYSGTADTSPKVSKFRMENLKADRVEGESTYDPEVVAPALGVYFNAVVS